MDKSTIAVASLREEMELLDRWCLGITKEIANQVDGGRKFGICKACDEGIHYTINDEMLFSEVVGVEVTSFKNVSNNFVKKVIVGGKYAVFSHTGSLENLL